MCISVSVGVCVCAGYKIYMNLKPLWRYNMEQIRVFVRLWPVWRAATYVFNADPFANRIFGGECVALPVSSSD